MAATVEVVEAKEAREDAVEAVLKRVFAGEDVRTIDVGEDVLRGAFAELFRRHSRLKATLMTSVVTSNSGSRQPRLATTTLGGPRSRSPSPTPHDHGAADVRTALAMAIISYFCLEWDGTVERIERQATQSIREFLGDPLTSTTLHCAWSLAWGPVVFQARFSTIADLCAFAVRSKSDPTRFVVAVTGTHPYSVHAWLMDANVVLTPVWPFSREHQLSRTGIAIPKPHTPGPRRDLRLSQGTLHGVHILQEMRDGVTGLTLLQFLQRQAQVQPICVTLTGHSLGGALAPAFALFLHDARNLWMDASGQSEVHVVSFAGPAFANEPLAKYYDAALGSNTKRVACKRDLVPCAWEVKELRRIGTLLEPQTCTPLLFRVVVSLLIFVVSWLLWLRIFRHDYRHVVAEQPPFTCEEAEPQPGRPFLKEIMVQHVHPYLVNAGLGSPAFIAMLGKQIPLYQQPMCGDDKLSLKDRLRELASMSRAAKEKSMLRREKPLLHRHDSLLCQALPKSVRAASQRHLLEGVAGDALRHLK